MIATSPERHRSGRRDGEGLFAPAPVPVTIAQAMRFVHLANRAAAVEGWPADGTDPVEVRIADPTGWRRCEIVGLDLTDDLAVGWTLTGWHW